MFLPELKHGPHYLRLHPILRFSIRYNLRTATVVLLCFTVFWRKQSEWGLTLHGLESKMGRNDNCGTCQRPVTSNDEGMLCDICCLWHHASCQRISSATLKAANADKDNAMIWHCRTCKKIYQKLKSLTTLEKDVVALKKGINDVQELIKTLEQRVVTLEAQKDSRTYADVTRQKELNVAGLTREVRQESTKQQERANNIMIRGTKPQDDDSKLVEDLTTALEIDLTGVRVQTKRVGAARQDETQLLRVTLSQEKRAELLRKARDLKTSAAFSGVFIQPDWTPEEQKLQFQLRQELRAKRTENPNKIYRIYRWRVCEVEKKRTSDQ